MSGTAPGPQKVEILVDGAVISSSNPLPTSGGGGGGGTVDQGKQGTALQSWYIQDGSGLLATAAKQDTSNTSLGSIDTKLSSQATAANQTTGNTSLSTIATQQTDGTQKTQVTNTVAVSGPLTDAQLRASAVPISAASLPLPTGAATASLQGAGLPATLVGGKLDVNLGTSSITLPVSGPLTDAQLRAAPVPATAAQGAGSGSAATYWYTRSTDGTNTMPTMDAAARSGYQRVTDGTNTAAVKAASTAAAASDPSMVVAVSPNSPATVTGAAATGTAVSGNPVLIAGQDGANARTMRLDTTGRPAGSSFQWRGAATSELLKSGAGVLRRVICGSNVAGSITLYDNTSATGTVIVSLTTTTSTPFNSVEINATFSTGLYAVSTGMSGGSYTIVWD